MAAEVGHADLAMHYFPESLYLDIADTHGNTVDGAHIANVGGVWAGLVHGFAGVRDSRRPRACRATPAGGLDRRCASASIGAAATSRSPSIPTGATVTVESGEPVPILAGGVITEVAPGGSLRVAGLDQAKP